MAQFAILLINFNTRDYLERCLQHLRTQQGFRLGQELELLILDNASADGSAELLRQLAPEFLRAQSTNLGFAGAMNLGLRGSSAPWVLSLNPDVLLAPDFFQAISKALQEHDQPELGMISPKLRRIARQDFLADRTEASFVLDSTGLFLDRMRRPYDRGQGSRDEGQFDRQPEILGPCGAAALYRRSMLERLAVKDEIFDERLFAYYEDIDLAWRARKAGFTARFVPQALGWHIRGGADQVRSRPKDPARQAIAARAHANRYLVLAKNEKLLHTVADLHKILFYELARHLFLAVTQPRLLLAALRLFLRDLPLTLQKRDRSTAKKDLTQFVRKDR